jgi:hypothetical protein
MEITGGRLVRTVAIMDIKLFNLLLINNSSSSAVGLCENGLNLMAIFSIGILSDVLKRPQGVSVRTSESLKFSVMAPINRFLRPQKMVAGCAPFKGPYTPNKVGTSHTT